MYRPSAQQFATPISVQSRVETDLNGAPEITYTDADPALDFCAWKGKGGSESAASGFLVVEDTAEVIMWYRPDITERDRMLLNCDTALAYDVVNVENVEMRNQFMILKVRRAVNA